MDERYRFIWDERLKTEIEGVIVPSYHHPEFSYPDYPSPDIALYILSKKDYYINKKIIDIGTGVGLVPLLLKKNGFNVVGLDKGEISKAGAEYTMELNDVYYTVILKDHTYLDELEYDVLIINQMFYDEDLKKLMHKVAEKEIAKGKEILCFSKRPEILSCPLDALVVQ